MPLASALLLPSDQANTDAAFGECIYLFYLINLLLLLLLLLFILELFYCCCYYSINIAITLHDCCLCCYSPVGTVYNEMRDNMCSSFDKASSRYEIACIAIKGICNISYSMIANNTFS